MSAPRDRWYVPRDQHPRYQELVKGDEALFQTMGELFVFSAAFGYNVGSRVPIEGEKQHTGFWRSLSEARDQPLLQAIAIAATGDLGVLEDVGDVIAIAEEYANGGFPLVLDLDRHDVELTLQSLAAEVLDRGEDRSAL